MSVDKFGRSSGSVARRPLLKAYVDRSIAKVQLTTAQSVRDSIDTIVTQVHALTVQYLDQQLSPLDAELKRKINDTRQELAEISQTVVDMCDRIIVLENKVDHQVEKMEETVRDIRERIIAARSHDDLRPTKPQFIIGEAEPTSVLAIDASTEELIIGEAEHTASREINSSAQRGF